MNTWILVFGTAAITSLLTLGVGVSWFQWVLKPLLQRRVDEQTDLAAARIRIEVREGALEALAESGLKEAIEGIGDAVRDGVLRGVEEADLDSRLEALERDISRRVRNGVVEGLASMATPGSIRDTTLTMTETGANLVSEGLSGFLGGLAKSIIPDEPRKPKP